jgi:uncharacterized repeat protein (TIGR03803 family)
MTRIQQFCIRMIRLCALAVPGVALAIAGTAIAAYAQTPTVLYNLGTNADDPAAPIGADVIAQGRDGNLYSVSNAGGSFGDGTAFNITLSGTPTVLHNFDGTDGSLIYSGLTRGIDGNLYGTTVEGGSHGFGSVFKITPGGTFTTLYNFTGSTDGGYPEAQPVQGKDGNFYGTTSGLNAFASTVYKITTAGKLTTQHTLTVAEGKEVQGGLFQGTDGNFYGNSNYGGSSNDGTIFKITAAGKLTVLHNFTGTDGSVAAFSLIQATDGNFYGATAFGGPASVGVVFKITPKGTFTVLHNMNGATDGGYPYSGLVQATDGKLYGVNNQGGNSFGTIYSITTSGTFSVVYTFDSTHGSLPQSTLTQDTNGLLYGDTTSGGTQNKGVFYSLNLGLGPFVNLESTAAKEGTKIGILGQGFSSSSVVEFGGTPATSVTETGTTYITATIPADALTGAVTVTTGATKLTSPQIFKVTPTFLSFSPASGPVGSQVILTGTGLTQTTKVQFGKVAATTFTVNNDTQVTADVPTGAVTGKIQITTKGGSVTSKTSFVID